ncbi:MAG: ABC transporter ATP-binding protein [candidate division Zixibacteria bacterium]|nr:ABC transporter ATP-binding protein [candidate division Zixibacteria bacterium]MDH3936355.1 ABC transporter ATP-binding protein [candidate division Zixibacteria bacterium]MDH4035392.1 ABC transporter ATP-binding protein [candidate division Zixibacteria bacterium]
MLQVIDLSKSYDRTSYAVKELSFEVVRGSILALLGHNGAGKSTTLRMISTMLAPTSGRVLIDDVDLSQAETDRLRLIKRNIGFVPETANLLSYLTPWEYLFYVGQMYGMEDESPLNTRVDTLVNQFSITEAKVKQIEHFSAGLKRRISIAAMLVNSPQLLLLDEPTAHLDPIGIKMLKEYLKHLRSEGVTVLLATHQLDIAEQLADQILIINEGQNLFHGTLDDLRERYPDSDGRDNLENFYSQLIGN